MSCILNTKKKKLISYIWLKNSDKKNYFCKDEQNDFH